MTVGKLSLSSTGEGVALKKTVPLGNRAAGKEEAGYEMHRPRKRSREHVSTGAELGC